VADTRSIFAALSTEDAWLIDRPPERVLADHVILWRSDPSDVEPLVLAVNESLDHLRPWMPWAQDPATNDTIGAFLREASIDWIAGKNFQFLIREAPSEMVLGGCGLHARLGPGALEIGYWTHVSQGGRGIATSAARALTRTALGLAGVDRVEIRCDLANIKSAAIPKKLGYRLDRIDQRPPATPCETEDHMVWVTGRGT
jgi:RimJ/RimL family protein N-acetyltransferase